MLIPETPNYERIRMRDARRIERIRVEVELHNPLHVTIFNVLRLYFTLTGFFASSTSFVKRGSSDCVPPRVQA